MYSFYRAWLMHDAFQSTIGNPPDVLLQIGPTCTQFAAHRAILISHSGYFKSVFTSPTSTSPVLVPNIGVAEFTSLLTWMYTGYLDLNLENIYNILLATHLLHMPNALEICRNFLIQNNQIINNNSEQNRTLNPPPPQQTPSTSSTVTSTTIIKPIPSRKFLPETLRNFLPIIPTHLKTNENTSFHKIATLARNDEPAQQEPPRIIIEQQIERKTPEIIDLKKKSKTPEIIPEVIETIKIASPKPSTSFQFNNRSPNPRSPSSLGSLSPNLSDKSDAVVLDYAPPKTNHKARKFKQQSNFIKTSTLKSSDKVIIDIACCDGPVRFHRVLNNCYGLTQATTITTATTTTMKSTTSDLMNKIMTHEMNSRRNKKLTNDSTIEDSSSSTDIVYTCVYCNHTFKSQYCYQKHARRHINPVTLSSTCKISNNNEPQQSNVVTRKNNFDSNSNVLNNGGGTNSTGSSVKREVKLLDMNVQYYPCKTCGSKFPSYYFVHKHRKMYHADEIEKEANNGGSGEATVQSPNGQDEDDIVMTTNKSMSSASSSSTSSVLSKEKSTGAPPPPPNKENDI